MNINFHLIISISYFSILNREFPALNGIQFSYAKARNGIIKEDDIIDNSANMATLKVTLSFNYFVIPISVEESVKRCNNWLIPLSMQSAIGSAGDIFLIPHRDLHLPTDPVGMRVKCPDCGENILSCDIAYFIIGSRAS
jgi:hypothetical protein